MGLRLYWREVCNHKCKSEQREPTFLAFTPLAVNFVVVRTFFFSLPYGRGAELSCERELACSCCAAPNTKPVLPLAILSVLSTSGVPHRSSLGDLSGPEVRRDTSGPSGCVEGPQARALAPAHPDALPLVSSCWSPSSSKEESHPEPKILTTLACLFMLRSPKHQTGPAFS